MAIIVFNDGANSSMGIQTVNNGLTASTATNAQLGGPLVQATQIQLAGHSFEVVGADGSFFQIVQGGAFTVNMPGGSGIGAIGINQGAAILKYTNQPSGSIQSLNISPSFMLVSDFFNLKGLQYNADYSAVGKLDNRWIPDYGAVKSLVSGGNFVATNKVTGSMASGNLITYAQLNITDIVYSIVYYFVIRAGIGTVGLSIQFTDETGSVQTITTATQNTIGVGSNANPIVLNVKQTTNIIINSVITGTAVCDLYTGIQFNF